MKLIINHVEHELVPIKEFREQYNLSESFGLTQFEPKSYEGLGSLDSAGAQMNQLREHILQLIPESITIDRLIRFIDQLQFQFQSDLFGINEAILLKDVEVEFAVAGFGDVLRSMMYKMISAKANQQEIPAFDGIYFGWINDSVRVSSQVHELDHAGNTWQIQVINHIYGRAGLQVNMNGQMVYIADGIYMCPAEGFMYTLLKDICHKIWDAVQ